ncbi:MAG: hypothetical protein IIV97_03830 [Oscillospiraceae bacterium]|nr:hypothetical protein [Oscillospiraceae bacterium]
MKNIKKAIAFILAVMLIAVYPAGAGALSLEGGIEPIKEQFVFGEGPVAGEYSVDYRYFSPVGKNDTEKYPLVIWLHGMGDGAEEGAQVRKSNIAYWASDEFQSRFEPAGGAFIFAARSKEEDNIFWSHELIEPLRAAIDDFIAKNKANIDLSRIYIGGYSMGGKMTYKMAVAYPELFAAAFPICPAWSPSDEKLELISDMPIWLVSSTRDPLVNYHLAVSPTWERLCGISNVPEKCRFSTLTKVCYEDGTKTSSSHHAWFAVNHDMFSAENGDYPYMTTVNGLGKEIKLEYPDGMISWLSSHTSDYDGAKGVGMGNVSLDDSTNLVECDGIFGFFELLFNAFLKVLKIK